MEEALEETLSTLTHSDKPTLPVTVTITKFYS